MMLLLGIDEQTVMAIMGWSDRRMVQRYQHVIDDLRVAAAARIGDLLMGAPVPAPDAVAETVRLDAEAFDAQLAAAEQRHKALRKADKKKTKTKKLASVDELVLVSATSATTSDTLAKIITLRPSA